MASEEKSKSGRIARRQQWWLKKQESQAAENTSPIPRAGLSKLKGKLPHKSTAPRSKDDAGIKKPVVTAEDSKSEDDSSDIEEEKGEGDEEDGGDGGTEAGCERLTEEDSKKQKKEYFVLFLGNLPYSVTKEDVMQHFRQTRGIKDVRLLTNKTTGMPRGCGYVEFTNPESHKLGLRLHHSSLKGRKINVEFTSVGRKTEQRTTKPKKKNKQAARFRNIVPKKPKGVKKKKDNK